MAYKINKLKQALEKLNKIRPDLKTEDCYPWDDGLIYIYDPKTGKDMELYKFIENHFK